MAMANSVGDKVISYSPTENFDQNVENNQTYFRDEQEPAIINACSSTEATHLLDDISGSIRIVTTWRHLLIGPVVLMYFFGNVSTYFVLIEYTNNYWKETEYHNANISVSVTVSPCDVNVSNLVLNAETKASSRSSQWIMYYSLASDVPALFANYILGAYVDIFGRKPIMIISILGQCIRILVMGIVIYTKADLPFFLIACFAEGLVGIHATLLAAALVYVADIARAGKSRAIGFAAIEGIVGTAIALASLSTGYMVECLGFKVTLFVEAGFLILCFIMATCFLPETFKKASYKNGKSLTQTLRLICQFFTRNDETNSRWKYQVTILALALTNMAVLSRIPTETLYQLAHPFCWSPRKVGIYVSARTLCMMFVGFGSLKLWQKCLDEVSLAMVGSLSFAASFYWTAFLSDDVSYYLVVVVGLFGPISTVMQKTILSKLTPPDKQGSIFASVGVLEIIAGLVGKVTTSVIYAETVSIMRGLVFLVLGSYNVIALFLALCLKIGWRKDHYKDREDIRN